MRSAAASARRASAPRGVRPAWILLLLLAAGVLHAASFAPMHAWYLQPLMLVPLFAAVRRATPARAGLYGVVFAVGWLGSGWWWLHISLHQYGGLPWIAAALAVLALALAMSLYLGAAMALAAALRTGRPGSDAALLAAAFTLAELARGSFFTGFPWSAAGYAHTVGPLAALAPWVGVYGIGAVAAWLAAVLALAAADRPPTLRSRLAALAGLPVGLIVIGAAQLGPRDFTEPAGNLRASLLQPAVGQDLKFDADHLLRNLDALIAQAHAATGPLVVAPESVIPIPQPLMEPETWRRLRAPFVQPAGADASSDERAVLVGIFLGNERDGYVNSMVGISARSSPSPDRFFSYGKRHLLPFGEFIPPGFGWFVRLLNIPLGDQARGTQARPFEVGGQRLRILICYEDLFAEELVESVVGAAPATVFVNASNLAWFGRHLVQDQHLQFSQMRALEFQRPFLRSTNTGATAALDHRGRLLARLPAMERGTLDVTVQGRVGVTPFARWLSAFGLAPLWLVALGVVAAAAAMRRRVAPPPPPPATVR
jgi:apolipoprotein N-acyltransferase